MVLVCWPLEKKSSRRLSVIKRNNGFSNVRSKILYQFHHVLHVESCCFLVIICSPTIPTGGIAENGNASFAFPPNVVDKTVYLNLPSTGVGGRCVSISLNDSMIHNATRQLITTLT